MPQASKAPYVSDLFGRIARRYDLMNTAMTLGLHHRWRHRMVQEALPSQPGLALDVATGTGDLALLLARSSQITHVIGLDFAPPMLELARVKARHQGLNTKLTFILGDALHLPFADDSFACVTSGFSLRNVADILHTLRQMHRVTSPGGKVVLLELTPLSSNGLWPALFRLYFHHLVPTLGQLVAGDRAAYAYLPASVTTFPDAEGLASLLRQAGFVQVSYRRLGLGTVAIHWGTKG